MLEDMFQDGDGSNKVVAALHDLTTSIQIYYRNLDEDNTATF